MTAPRSTGKIQLPATTRVTNAKLAAIMTAAATLARRGMTRCWCQARMEGPNLGRFHSHSRNRSELLEKAQVAMIRNTVVGMPGATAPTNPRPTLSQANANRNPAPSGGASCPACRRPYR